MTARPVRVLFVCLGNICRSPLARGVFQHVVDQEGLSARFEIDSAGTSDYHLGEAPDRRTRELASRRGIALTGHARQIGQADLERFDYVIVMDADNLADVQRLAHAVRHGAELHLLREFDPVAGGELNVPDPYFGGVRGFEDVHDIIDRSCRGLLEHIRTQRTL